MGLRQVSFTRTGGAWQELLDNLSLSFGELRLVSGLSQLVVHFKYRDSALPHVCEPSAQPQIDRCGSALFQLLNVWKRSDREGISNMFGGYRRDSICDLVSPENHDRSSSICSISSTSMFL